MGKWEVEKSKKKVKYSNLTILESEMINNFVLSLLLNRLIIWLVILLLMLLIMIFLVFLFIHFLIL